MADEAMVGCPADSQPVSTVCCTDSPTPLAAEPAQSTHSDDKLSPDDPDKPEEEKSESPAAAEPEGPPTMSKRARKRMEAKLYKKTFLKERRAQERLKKKRKVKEAKAAGIDLGPSRKALKKNTMEKSSCKVKVVVDCSFDDLMSEKDVKSIVKQVNFCYASNRRALDPLQFHVTSFSKRLKSIMDDIGQHSTWDVHLHETSYEENFTKEDIVYLSSDSKNVLTSLDDTKAYIIGGLVDHNHHKGLCLKLAEEKGFAHAQLPIGDYITLESRNVLAVNHVFDILLRFTENPDWKEAFYKVIPQRKIVGKSAEDTKTCETDKVATQNENEEQSKTSNDLDGDNGINKDSSDTEVCTDVKSTDS